jgi:nucleoside-diphosphate-sugar epimerase
MSVVAINRSGAPAAGTGEWGAKVEWVKADVFDKDAWSHHCEGATAVISSVGTFGSNATMEKVCGDANIAAVEAAAAAGVDRFVFVSNSAVGTDLPDFLLHGYFNGKLRAEQAVAAHFPGKGASLRPGMIYGTRDGIPLGLLGVPLDFLFTKTPLKALKGLPVLGPVALVAPVPVASLAKAAVAAAEGKLSGVVDVEGIQTFN